MSNLSYLDFIIEFRKEYQKYFDNYLFYSQKIKREAERILGPVKVFIFGSLLRKNEVPRDIDILIISPKVETLEQKSKTIAKITKKLGFSYLFEFHLITPKEYKEWYSHFIKEKVEI